MSTTKAKPLTPAMQELLDRLRAGWTLHGSCIDTSYRISGPNGEYAGVAASAAKGLLDRDLVRCVGRDFPTTKFKLTEDRWFTIAPLKANEFKRLDLPWGVYSGTDERVTLNVKLVQREFDRDSAEAALVKVAARRKLTQIGPNLYAGRTA
jgi:hypothetical protein